MSEKSATLIDLVQLLISCGMSPETSLRTSGDIDRMFGISARGSTENQREKWRLKKQRQRSKRANVPQGQEPAYIESSLIVNSQSELKKERKKTLVSPDVPGDNWPADYGDQFWNSYPRRTGKLAAMRKLAAVRKSGMVTFAHLMLGVGRYAASTKNTEERYIKHPATWLNAGCWSDEPKAGGIDGEIRQDTSKIGFSGIAARLRRSIQNEDYLDFGPTESFEPAYRR